MISLKPYLFGDKSRDADAEYRRIIGLFLQGIALHAVEGDQSDYGPFRADIDELAKQITPDTPMSQLLVVVGGALRAMEEYNRRTSKVIHRQNHELQNMVSMLTQTVITIGSSGEASVNKLQDVEKSIEHACKLDDMQLLKLRLGDCLEAVSGRGAAPENRRPKHARKPEKGAGEFPRTRRVAAAPDLDAATGLPSMQEAMKAIQAAVASPRNKFLTMALVSRVPAVNARFGDSVGDRVLTTFVEHFRRNLAVNDRLFRWHGPAVIAVLEREERLEKVRTEIRRFIEVKLEKTIEVGNRTILLPISASWSIFPVAPPLEDLLKKMEAFMAAQIPRD
jgi:GGDEF domain-containing protein